ncbi:AIDA-I autotransporter precursor [Buttiauxella agrestis]|uniref:AIDA-I autotransporter n=2 Tax=Buttiauxella agrestis TaxID=82977 RepID=A0A381CA92_9ENTR|nr:AIDA-I autotransporter precursor [Buttiauxella agrestis]
MKTERNSQRYPQTNKVSAKTNIRRSPFLIKMLTAAVIAGIGGVAQAATVLGDSIINDETLVFDNSDSVVDSDNISGTGSLVQTGSGILFLTGDNTFTGTTTIDSGSTLSLGIGGNSGMVSGDIIDNGTLVIDRHDDETFAQTISGTGNVNISNPSANIHFTADNTYTGLTTNEGVLFLGNGGTTGSVAGDIVNNGILTVIHSDDYTLGGLTGTGDLNQSGSGNLILSDELSQHSLYITSGSVEVASSATVNFGSGGVTSEQESTLRLDSGAHLNTTGGAYLFGELDTDVSSDGGLITAKDAIIGPQATLNIVGLGSSTPTKASELPQSLTTVIHTTAGIRGDFSTVSFGTTGMPDYLIAHGEKSADNLDYNVGYELAWTSGGADANGNFTLTPATDNFDVDVVLADEAANAATGWDGKTLTKAGEGNLTLSALNTYTGATLINGGSLTTGIAHTLDSSSGVDIASGASLILNGYNQTLNGLTGTGNVSLGSAELGVDVAQGNDQFDGVITGSGSLSKQGSGTLSLGGTSSYSGGTTVEAGDLLLTQAQATGTGGVLINNEGTLELAFNDESFSNDISGSGKALVSGTDVAITGDNTAFAGLWDITGSAIVTQASQLGSASVTDDGLLNFNNDSDWTLTNTISGSGGVNKTGSGTLIINSGLTYSGDTHISGGTLQIGETQGSLDSTGTVYVEAAGTLRGNGFVGGSVVNNGVVGVLSDSTSQLHIAGDLENNGIVDLTNNVAGNTLTVEGNYSSNDGQLIINSDLNGDDSPTDEMVVNGDTSGNTLVTVNNMHGLGEQTVNGIEVVNVGGQSDGTFTLKGRAVSGAYEYSLYQGTPTENDGNWYLRSQSNATDPTDPTDPTNPDGPTPEPGSDTPVLRPEDGSYLANQRLANSVFLTTMHDRNGENRQSGDDSPLTWAHFDAGRINSKAGSDSLSTGSDTAILRVGSDIYRHDFGNQRINVGVMTGYADVSSHTDSRGVSATSDSNLKGYNFGIYGTWYGGSADQKTGPYVDTWLQYGTFHNTVNGSDLPEEKYSSHNWTGSLETGYDLELSSAHGLYIQPQFQAIYTKYSQGDQYESNGTRVHSDDSGGVTTRLGSRLYGQLHDAGSTQPYVEVNWWHGGSSNSIQMDDATVSDNVPVNRYEVKIGAQTNVGKNWQLWVATGVEAGKDGYSSVHGLVGGKYSW